MQIGWTIGPRSSIKAVSWETILDYIVDAGIIFELTKQFLDKPDYIIEASISLSIVHLLNSGICTDAFIIVTNEFVYCELQLLATRFLEMSNEVFYSPTGGYPNNIVSRFTIGV